MLVADFQPASVVEDEGFIRFLKVNDQRYQPPSRRTLMRDHLPQLYEEKVAELQEKLMSIEHCTLTTDLWTSNQTMGYLTVTCHFISQSWEIESYVLETTHVDQAHTIENLASELMTITDKWNISSKVHCTVTDNATNIKGAVRANAWNHLSCFAHTLNLIVSNSLSSVPEAQSLIQSVKNIVTFFRRSTKAMDKLTVMQSRLNIPQHKLIQDIETRWNSVFYMLERYLEQEEAIRTTLCMMDRNDLLIPTEKNSELSEMVDILRPFEAVTREMSADKYVSSSKIIPLAKGLQRCSSNSNNKISEALCSQMSGRFLNMEANVLIASATLLDPRFKKIGFSDQRAGDQIARHLTAEITQMMRSREATSQTTATATTNEVAQDTADSVWRFFDEQVSSQSNMHPGVTAFSEVDKYFKTPVLQRTEDPLNWWKENSQVFPQLAPLARKYLSLLATSVPSERLFSKAGELVSLKRNRLKPKNVNMFLFLNKYH
ncbi:PREDICTED: zinc finger BED domain-containing protein 1-like [Amphimedon queenslandica]|uniref:HAT C-terminal dimerisation domain-containing protein n=1 Tax=Amphimedon queenslandica TaxID=400682 RepID=A0A1X7UFA9_AMPQE|nr:PREDICTED: zinc finger BED domain-containing protein 1-like [Amphimedon queenslandica]|eukprot:XP_011405235.1 PREDICTED: zinc finger BED domain-containing protein 1-like [Amphimedon queenslandica]